MHSAAPEPGFAELDFAAASIPLAASTLNDPILDVDQVIVTSALVRTAKPAPHGQHDKTDDRQAHRHGQKEQPKDKTECEQTNAENNQAETRQRTGGRLIEWLPRILHARCDLVSARVFLCRSEDLREGHYRELVVGDSRPPRYLLATRFDGQPRAWLNACPHQGRPLNFAPDRFLTNDAGQVICAHHGAVFEPDQGRCISGPCRNACLSRVKLQQRDEGIYLLAESAPP